MVLLQGSAQDRIMALSFRTSIGMRTLACWNWKCALLSATVRSVVYLGAMTRSHHSNRLAIVLVELAYVTATAGVYAGLQQRALSIRSRVLGNCVIALVVPGFAQALDWLAHWSVGAPVPLRATVAASVFTIVSALFHLHVMRRGVFLTGNRGRSLAEDFQRMPRLVLGFLLQPLALLASARFRLGRPAESEMGL